MKGTRGGGSGGSAKEKPRGVRNGVGFIFGVKRGALSIILKPPRTREEKHGSDKGNKISTFGERNEGEKKEKN